MSFYSYLAAYPQMIDKIQKGLLQDSEEMALVRDFTWNNLGFALRTLLGIRHSAIDHYRTRFIRLVFSGTIFLAAAVVCLILAWSADLSDAVWARYLLTAFSIMTILAGCWQYRLCYLVVVQSIHNLIKNHFRTIDRHQVYKQLRHEDLEKYGKNMIKVTFCEGWPERAILLRLPEGLIIAYEELYYSDDDDLLYLNTGELHYQWVEDTSARTPADSIDQADKLIAENFSHGTDKDSGIFNWLD